MGEWRLFPEGTVPEYTTAAWYAGRERAPHLEQGGGHTERLIETAAQVHAAAKEYGLRTVSDLGAGDGGLLSLLERPPIVSCWGYDLQQTNVDGAVNDRGVRVELGDVVDGEWYDPDLDNRDGTIVVGQIVVCTEMLEHLIDPHGFVRRIAQRARWPERDPVLVASSPWMERPGNAYEFHTWAWNQDGYRALLEQGGFEVVRQQICGGFQVLTGVRR